MEKLTLKDGKGLFEITKIEAKNPSRNVLFAVGGGGDPARHYPLLMSIADSGCTVIAPHFQRLVSPTPTEDDLELRARRLKLALDAYANPRVSVVGVGHSIGATMLLALAGGQEWMRPGEQLSIISDKRIDRLVLMAPATGFFQAPGALDDVHVPILAWVGTKDVITPPVQTELLSDVLGARVPVEVRIVNNAGHFSFMNEPPSQVPEPLPDRDTFMAKLTEEVCRFIID